MRPVEIQVKINVARREMEYWEGILKTKNCMDCQEFQQNLCHKYNAEPPPEVKEVGCDEWNWDCIPF
jgi:hypothetical protein